MALPLGQWLVESAGHAESSITGKILKQEFCVGAVRTKLSRISLDHGRENYGGYSTIQNRYYDYRYHVQDAFYSDGYEAHLECSQLSFFWLPAQLLNADVSG